MSDYRYWHAIAGDPSLPPVVFIINHPGSIDEDFVTRGCRRLAGGAPAYIVSLFAHRCRYPMELWTFDDPIGPECNDWLRIAVDMDCKLVAAWGANAPVWRVQEVMYDIFAGQQIYCAGTGVNGAPNNPEYLPAETRLEPWQALSTL